MRKASWRPSPALLVSVLALLLALGGTVYAAKKVNGRSIVVKSIPGNRLKPHSIGANRLKPGVLGKQFSGPLTGADIDESSLGTVPSAVHAQSADSALNAINSETALNAVNAVDAQTVNGFGAGCGPGTQAFAGACWEASPSAAVTAPAAAVSCAARGGSLPDALELAAFAGQEGVRSGRRERVVERHRERLRSRHLWRRHCLPECRNSIPSSRPAHANTAA